MPLNTTEIEGFTEAVQEIIDSNGSQDPNPSTLVRRGVDGDIHCTEYKGEKFYLPETVFAGEREAIELATSNDPDDLLAKVNELVAVANLSRR